MVLNRFLRLFYYLLDADRTVWQFQRFAKPIHCGASSASCGVKYVISTRSGCVISPDWAKFDVARHGAGA